MKTYRQHGCTANHRNHRTAARCMIPGAAWILGDGHFAVIAWCGVPTITLHSTHEAAQESLGAVNATGCGGRCQRRHEIILLALDELVTA